MPLHERSPNSSTFLVTPTHRKSSDRLAAVLTCHYGSHHIYSLRLPKDRSMATVVTQADIVSGLRGAGVGKGDLLFVHTAMSKFGYVEGGAETVVRALLNAVGPEGTLAMPGFTFGIEQAQPPVLDVKRTPVWAGKVYETFRTRTGVLRSHHLTHSVLALGPLAQELTRSHSITPCGKESPFARLESLSAKIVLLGVSHNSSTIFHSVEEELALPHVGFQEIHGASIIDEHDHRFLLPTKIHRLSKPYDFNRLNPVLEAERLQSTALIGDSVVRVMKARGICEAARSLCRRDPEGMVQVGDTRVSIPVSRSELVAG